MGPAQSLQLPEAGMKTPRHHMKKKLPAVYSLQYPSCDVLAVPASCRDQHIPHRLLGGASYMVLPLFALVPKLPSQRHIPAAYEQLGAGSSVQLLIRRLLSRGIIIHHTVPGITMCPHIVHHYDIGPSAQCLQVRIRHMIAVHQHRRPSDSPRAPARGSYGQRLFWARGPGSTELPQLLLPPWKLRFHIPIVRAQHMTPKAVVRSQRP